MALTYPIGPGGLELDVLVNLEAAALLPLWQTGVRPAAVPARGMIDTGSDLTAVSQAILQRLAVPAVGRATTQGIAGPVAVVLYRVSIHLYDAGNPGLPWITWPSLLVSELPTTLPFDVLVGMDVLRTCRMHLDGPAGWFTLD